MNLSTFIKDYQTISIIGTVKNAGKTTTLNRLIKENKSTTIALTSIGLDGEEKDTIYSFEKPKITVYPGMIIATAIEALEITTCSYTILEKTAINSPLGVIVIIKITQEGTILLAGPSLKNQLIMLKRKILDYRPTYIFIDGALFRKSSASTKLADAVILATGASYARSMSSCVLHTRTLSRQLTLPKYPINSLDLSVNYILDASSKKTVLNADLLSNPQTLKKHLSNTTTTLFLKGALNNRIAQTLIQSRHKFEALNLLIKDATHFLLKDSYYHHLKTIGVNFYVLNPIELVLITVNPTTKKGYFYDEQQFITALKNTCNVPIFNVLKDLE